MDLFVIGTSHAVASMRMRERLHVDLDEVYPALTSLRKERGTVEEAIPLSTCGRLELYGVAPDVDRAAAVLGRLLSQRTSVARVELARHTFVHRGGDAVRHLLRVSAGLDSVVHGEAQILGQVREAAHHPLVGTTEGPVLHRLFQHALKAGKRVRSETEIGRGAASLASAALAMLERELGGLRDRSILVVGAGDTGALMARLLSKSGVRRLVIANRTLERAEGIATGLGAEAEPLERLETLLGEVDLVVGSVTTTTPLLTEELVRRAVPSGQRRFFLDLAHPRSVEDGVGRIDGVTVFDLEHVFARVDAARRSRAEHVPRAEEIVEEEAAAFEAWLRTRETAALVKAVRRQVLEHAMAEADRYVAKAPAEQQESMRRLARSVARALLHRPTVALRDADPASEEGRALLDHASRLFGVDAP